MKLEMMLFRVVDLGYQKANNQRLKTRRRKCTNYLKI